MGHEGAEPRLALSTMEIRRQRCRLDGERYLRRERAEGIREVPCDSAGDDTTSAPRTSSRTINGDTHVVCFALSLRSACTYAGSSVSTMRSESDESWRSQARVPSLIGSSTTPSDAATTTASPSRTSTSLAAVSGPSRRPTAEMAAAATWSWSAAATRSIPALRRARSRETARSSCRTSPAILATTSRNSTADATISDQDVGVVQRLGEADRGRYQARTGEEDQPNRCETCTGVGRRLFQSTHRRMKRCCTPEEVIEDPPGVEAQLVVERVLQERVVVRRVGSHQADDAADEQPERRASACRSRRRGG